MIGRPIAVINTIITQAPNVWDISGGNDFNQIVSWLNDGTLSPKPQLSPQGGPPNVLYYIFMPWATQLTNGTNSDGTPNTNVCGRHNSGVLNDGTPVFWALVRTDQAPRVTELAFVSSFAFCVSHELSEALTDADPGLGFVATNGCEIADICELNQFNYRGWSVDQYWPSS